MLFLQFSDFGIKCFLGHNFGSRHARRPIEGSIVVDDHLISKTILRKKWLIGLAFRTSQSWSKIQKHPLCDHPTGELQIQIKKIFLNRN